MIVNDSHNNRNSHKEQSSPSDVANGLPDPLEPRSLFIILWLPTQGFLKERMERHLVAVAIIQACLGAINLLIQIQRSVFQRAVGNGHAVVGSGTVVVV